MARSAAPALSTVEMRPLLGFAAAFFATLIFHQIGLGLLHLIGITPAVPWVVKPVPPFGVPQVIARRRLA